MADEYEIVRYRPELKAKLLQLQTHLWGPDAELNRAYFAWKYEQNPYVSEPLIYLALQRGEAVGMRGLCGACWEVGTPPARQVMPYADDLVIAPGHRNRGLHTRIMQAAFADLAERGYAWVVSMGGGRITVLGSLAMGWQSIGSMEPVGWRAPHARWWRSMRAFAGRRRLLWRFRESGLLEARCESQPFLHLDRAVGRRPGRGSHPVRIEREARPAAMAELVARLPHDGRVRHVRDAEFFAWRLRKPGHEHRFLYWDDGRLEGYLVLQQYRTVRAAPRVVHILDWEAGDERVRAELLRAAQRRGRFPALVCWSAAVPPAGAQLLQHAGFEPTDLKNRERGLPTALVRSVTDDLPLDQWMVGGRRLQEPGSWDLRMLYQD
jgi:GNAT superfamily N-acetyltransferase